MQKIYICECGREFTSPNSFNGHKSHCKIHLNITGKLELRNQIDSINGTKTSLKFKHQAEVRKQEKLDQWISEKHTCEKCGKVMIEKYGSGRFCSRACANSHTRTKEFKEKMSQLMQEKYKDNLSIAKYSHRYPKEYKLTPEYLANPDRCAICDTPILHKYRNKRKTCGNRDCVLKLLSKKASEAVLRNGGNNNPYGVRGTAKYGTYKGFHCDSSYELAFVIYCLDHNIPIQRNSDGFEYYYKEELKVYYPDFIINNTYIEIKNYTNDQVEAKIYYFPSQLNYKILFKKDLNPCFTYCKEIYGSDWVKLYDRNYPSWMDKIE